MKTPKDTKCIIKCRCGGHIQVLPEDGVYYTLTEEKTIIFRGYCIKCQELVQLQQSILELLLHCPDTGRPN